MNDLTNDLGPVLNEEKQPVSDADVIAMAFEEKILDVTVDGLIYKIKVQRNRVPFRLTQLYHGARLMAQIKHLKAAGFTEADDKPGGVLSESTSEEALRKDPRYQRFLALMATDADILQTRADLAAACLVATNVPQLMGREITGDTLLKLGRIGEAVIDVAANFMLTSLRDLSAVGASGKAKNTKAATTPKKANTKRKSPTTPGSMTDAPPAT